MMKMKDFYSITVRVLPGIVAYRCWMLAMVSNDGLVQKDSLVQLREDWWEQEIRNTEKAWCEMVSLVSTHIYRYLQRNDHTHSNNSELGWLPVYKLSATMCVWEAEWVSRKCGVGNNANPTRWQSKESEGLLSWIACPLGCSLTVARYLGLFHKNKGGIWDGSQQTSIYLVLTQKQNFWYTMKMRIRKDKEPGQLLDGKASYREWCMQTMISVAVLLFTPHAWMEWHHV